MATAAEIQTAAQAVVTAQSQEQSALNAIIAGNDDVAAATVSEQATFDVARGVYDAAIGAARDQFGLPALEAAYAAASTAKGVAIQQLAEAVAAYDGQ